MWPSSKSGNLVDRMKQLLSTGEEADVHFLVGQGDGKELVPAHKIILMSSSDVFTAMFRFDTKNAKTNVSGNAPSAAIEVIKPVEVTDVDVDAFKAMLSYIYADDLSGLNGDNAMAVVYAAQKYNINGLFKACLDFPISELPNVFYAFAIARFNDQMKNFAHRCLLYIDQNADTLLKSEAFFNISQELLCEIFERDQLKIGGEISIWNAALGWAYKKCRQNGMELFAKNYRAVLGPALFKIRFPLIPKEDFAKSIVPSSVLAPEEVVAVYQLHCLPNFRGMPGLYPLPFSTQERICDRKEWTLFLEIPRLSECERMEETSFCSNNAYYVGGFPWKIKVQIRKRENSIEKCLHLFLWCTLPIEDSTWSCTCTATYRIVSRMVGRIDFVIAFGSNHTTIYNSKRNCLGPIEIIPLPALMDPNNGWYIREEDKVIVAIDVKDVLLVIS